MQKQSQKVDARIHPYDGTGNPAGIRHHFRCTEIQLTERSVGSTANFSEVAEVLRIN